MKRAQKNTEKKLIAYLILTHGNVAETKTFVSKLSSSQSHFFIHVDKKVDISQFEQLQAPNVTFVKKRFDVTWKGFSQVDAEAELLKTAVESEYDFSYYSLHSGVDAPLQSKQSIEAFFRSAKKNYINYREIRPNTSVIKYFTNEELWMKISKWHFYDNLKINWRPSSNKLRLLIYRAFVFTNIVVVNTFLPRKKVPRNVTYYFGDAWWSINAKAAKYVAKEWHNKYLHKIFKYTDCPDEMYFQTVIMNSPHKKDTVNNYQRYINWDEGREKPAILDERDYMKIDKDKPLFGRKVDLEKSEKLMEKLKLW